MKTKYNNNCKFVRYFYNYNLITNYIKNYTFLIR